MSVRVIARLRPLHKSETETDQILSVHQDGSKRPTIVKIPHPKNNSEEYSFHFQSVYDQDASQQDIFELEIAPTIKHLFQGFDVTLFAYGVTGTGKTHTMRGGKSLVDRGMIPRMLSNIYRKSKALEKNTNGSTSVAVSMSYYEIYNDKVFDLFEAPEQRTPHGLPIREAEGGKTVVAGLSEVLCSNLKDFELLYDKANSNRSVGATKLNAQSSRSHAILCVKVTVNTPTEQRSSTISAIDLAGSEDNRRTGNEKERMVESASINKSLFVLAQCVEAISKKHARIPDRESKMTRILNLGQNHGLTVMILNLAPTKAFHLDTLSSLNFANRTKKIEVREVENEPVYKASSKTQVPADSSIHLPRQALRPLSIASSNILANKDSTRADKDQQDRPAKLFSVYADPSKQTGKSSDLKPSPLKRKASEYLQRTQPVKQAKLKPSSASFIRRGPPPTQTITTANLESLVERKVAEVLAAREASQKPSQASAHGTTISADMQARLDRIEKRLEGQEGERAEGLSYLLMAKQAQARGHDKGALDLYEAARPFFPDNEKLQRKIERLRLKLRAATPAVSEPEDDLTSRRFQNVDQDDSYQYTSPRETPLRQRNKLVKRIYESEKPDEPDESEETDGDTMPTPRTSQLLAALNSRDPSSLRCLPGLGVKKVDAILERLQHDNSPLRSWRDIEALEIRGVGRKAWLSIRREIGVCS